MVSARPLTVRHMLAAAIITAGATVALAMLAFLQIRASQKQASEVPGAATLQATIALQADRETREAAERQWQPRVIAHPWFWAIPGDRQGTQAERSLTARCTPPTTLSIRALAQLADEAGITLIELALAFVLRHPTVTAAIIGPRTMDHLESQLGAADIQLLEFR